MTDTAAPGGPARRRRLSKRVVRTWAYVGGAVSFVVPGAVLVHAPRPAAADPAATPSRHVIEVHKTIRRIIVDPPSAPASSEKPQVHVAQSGGSGGSASAPVSTHCSTCP